MSDMRGLSDRLAALSPEQRVLFAARLRSSGVGRLEADTIPRRIPGSSAPLSFAQQRLWFLQRLEPGSAAYNIPSAARLKGTLHPEALRWALQTIMDRHESLRTTFREEGGVPIQVVAEGSTLPLPVTDLSRSAEPEAEIRRLAGKESRTPFDLEQGPLIRAQLIRLNPQDHVLLLTVHHSVSDGWSMGVLMKELAVLYRAGIAGKPSPLPDLPLQYADYASWQRSPQQTDKLGRQLAYWRERLAGGPPRLELPTHRRRSRSPSPRAVRATLSLPKGLTDELKALSRGESATLFMTLLAGFKVLLARYSGQEDIVVGTPISGRSHVELEGLIGCFLNTLVLRTDVSGDPSFREVVARIREIALGAYANQELPFERLVEQLQPTRDLAHNPLFQVLFQAGNTPGGGLKLDGLDVSRVPAGGTGSKFDLSFRVRERAGGLSCICAGNADLFDRELLGVMLDQYRSLLEQAIASPDQPISTYSLVTDCTERVLPNPRVVLAEPAFPLVADLVNRVAMGAPSLTAIEQGGQSWSYGELVASADALSHRLQASGLDPGAVVAVAGRPTFGLVSAMLAILQSGRTMLPIATDLPEHRKRLMLQEAGAKLLLRLGAGESDWYQGLPLQDLQICEHTGQAEDPVQPERPSSSVHAPPGPDDPAYVFFTSGTTGTPKAVLGLHKGLSHFVTWQACSFELGPDDRAAQLAGLSFDVVLRDIFTPLTTGATLCLPPAELPSEAVVPWLAEAGITVVHVVPSLAQTWLAQAPPRLSLPSLRWIFSAGEPLTDALVLDWRRVAPHCRVVNLYGPTETTMVKCFYRVPDEVESGIQPVGESLPESQALILTAAGQLGGVNEIGEIVLRTPFRTRGYINAPEAQERQFITNPFTGDPRDVLYRTGDLGRYRPDGSLTVLSRLDQQVKIRGVRIEPEEVTSVLSRHAAVSSCAVIARPDHQGETALVAYVVPTHTGPAAAELRVFLAERLPAALVPSTFVFLDALPLTPNGKLDLRALPAPGEGAGTRSTFVAPRTPVESLLAQIWSEVLGVPRVGVDDDFFALGGHSLRATQVIARARGALGIDLPLRSLFETPTVAGLSLIVTRHLMESSGARR
jgi:amino acid adenylation domain-containing protein